MRGAYETFPLGLRLGHAALLRNLDRFADLGGVRVSVASADLAAFVALYLEFLDVHHRGEDDFIFPALRESSPGRTTDAAHLDRWSADHRDIDALGQELSRAAARLDGGGGALADLGRASLALRQALEPHLASEEQILTEAHLREMITEPELEAATAAIGKKNRSRGLAMASFLVHSLDPHEQKALLGDTPWVFRKVLLGVLGERRMRRFRRLLLTEAFAL